MQNLSIHYFLKKVKLQSFGLLKLITEGKTNATPCIHREPEAQVLVTASLAAAGRNSERPISESTGRRTPHLAICL